VRTKWEYIVLDHPGRDLLQDKLVLYGDAGWELCNSGYEGGSGSILIFKRQRVIG
jgi:hypothetical protein